MSFDGLIITLTHLTLNAHSEQGKVRDIPTPYSSPTAIAAYPTSTHIAEGTSSGDVILRDAQTLEKTGNITAVKPCKVTCISVSTGATLLATGHSDGTVALHDLQTSNTPTVFKEVHPILSLSFHHATEPRYILAQTSVSIAVFSPTTRQLVSRITPSAPATRSYTRTPLTTAKLTAAAFSPLHYSLLVAADDTGCITVWDVTRYSTSARARTDPKLAAPPPPHARFTPSLRAPATGVAFVSDGTLVVGGFDKQLRFFDPSLTRLLFAVSCPAPISALAIRGHLAVLGLTDGSFVTAHLNVPGKSASFGTRIHLRSPSTAPSVAVRSVLLPMPSSSSSSTNKAPSTRIPSVSTNSGKTFATLRSIATSEERALPVLPSVDFETSTSLLESIDDLLSGRSAHDPNKAPSDADVFSPVSRRSPPPNRGKSAVSDDESNPIRKSPLSPEFALRSKSDDDFKNTDSLPHNPQILFRSNNDSHFLNRLSPNGHFEAPARVKSETDITQLSPSSKRPNTEESLLLSSTTAVTQNADSTEKSPNISKAAGTGSLSYDMPSAEGTRPITDDHIIGEDVSSLEGCRFTKAYSQPSPNVLSKMLVTHRGSKSHSQSSGFEQPQHLRQIGNDLSMQRETDSFMSKKSISDEGTTRRVHNEDLNMASESSNEYSKPVQTDVKPTTTSGNEAFQQLSTLLRETVRAELDERLLDLRDDILNIHSEMVVMTSRHSEELRSVVVDRDETIKRLNDENKRLRADNERLRRKYGLV